MSVELLSAIAAVASAVAAALAWAAKLWWGKEYAAAKNEIIKAKDAQIEGLNSQIGSLRELTPMRIREYFLSVTAQLEEYNDLLRSQLEEAGAEIEQKSAQIEKLGAEGELRSSDVVRLESERREIQEKAETLERQLQELREKHIGEDVVTWPPVRIDPRIFDRIQYSSGSLSNVLGFDEEDAMKLVDLSGNIKTYYETLYGAYTYQALNADALLKKEVPPETEGDSEDEQAPEDNEDDSTDRDDA